jgi:tRNA nucleotidyltransferase (CCA-adding enzyme)
MGGSGGFFSPPSKSLDEYLKEQEKSSEARFFTREVNTYVQTLLSDLNDRDSKQINKHLEIVKKALDKEIEGTVELSFGGSVSKHTYANGFSDVDMLVKIHNSSLLGKTPSEVLNYFKKQIKDKIPNADVSIGKLAVTVWFRTGHEIQLLPCLETSNGYKISKAGSDEWSSVIKPEKFADKLTQVNRANNNKVVPVIKIIKSLNERMPKEYKLSGYHTESLAIEAFKNYTGPKTYQSMIHHFYEQSKTNVMSPIKDRTGQSLHVDEYLGQVGDIKRKQVSNALQRLSSRLKKADLQKSIQQWQELIES